MQRVKVGAAALDAAFPYMLAIDRSLRVLAGGRVLTRLMPELAKGGLLFDHFDIDRWPADFTYESLERMPLEPLVLRSRRLPALVLQGQVARAEGGDALVFLPSPRITFDAFEGLGITPKDFAPHDATVDCLFLLHAQDEALAESRRLSEELTKLNAELERRVAERTARLEEEKRNLERVQDELRLAQRLEAVGQLAAGVAHEINTPIQYVSDSLHFMRSACDDLVPMLTRIREACAKARAGEPSDRVADRIDAAWADADAEFLLEQIPKALDRTFDGVDRVASIVKAMKAFAHPGTEDRAPADLNEALSNTLVVSKNEYKYVADVELELGALPPVVCSVGELNQVFLNLVVNAAHAVADVVKNKERGRICVRSRAEGDSVAIEIEDTGSGIPIELRDRIFDPFFTTKPVGKGTGQGLTLARSIVSKHGGSLTFDSEVGKGTKFVIRLPVSPEATCRI